MASRRVRARVVDIVRTSEGLRAVSNAGEPTPERLAHGDVVVVRNPQGGAFTVPRSLNVVEQLALAGDLGDDVARLLAAAEWFIERGEAAELRGRLVHSQLVAATRVEDPDIRQRARIELARAYDAMGADAWPAVFDALIWNMAPRGPDRRALFRAGLYALARHVTR